MRTKSPYPPLTMILAALPLLTVNAYAQGILGPPHQDVTSPSIQSCIDCHDVRAVNVPKLMPVPPGWIVRDSNNLTNENTIFNLKCWECHSGSVSVTYGNPPVTQTLVDKKTHSSLVSGNTKYGQWAVGCTVCHNPHGNGGQKGEKFIWESIILDNIEVYGSKTAKSGNKTVVFDGPTGPNSFADGDATYNGICEVCHTETKYHQNSSNGDHTHYVGQNCITCHSHSTGFVHGGGGSGTGCEECHGHDVGYEYSPGMFSQGKGTFKSHSAHTENDADDSNGPNLTCAGCHDVNNFPLFADGNNLAATTVCNQCHNDATGIATGSLVLKPPPAWNTTSLTCTSCHAAGPSYTNNSPKTNSHAVHSGFSCEKCHSTTTSDGSNIDDPAVHPKGTYTLQPGTGVNFNYAFAAGGGTCSNISCHGGSNAAWGDTLILGCNGCHGYPPVQGDGKNINAQYDSGKGFHVTSWDQTDPYGMGGHIIVPAMLQPSSDIYGDRGTGYNECYKCHENGIHANGIVEVQITEMPWSTPVPKPSGLYERQQGFGFNGVPRYNGIPGNTGTSKTCSNIVCHQGGDTPSWSCPGGE